MTLRNAHNFSIPYERVAIGAAPVLMQEAAGKTGMSNVLGHEQVSSVASSPPSPRLLNTHLRAGSDSLKDMK